MSNDRQPGAGSGSVDALAATVRDTRPPTPEPADRDRPAAGPAAVDERLMATLALAGDARPEATIRDTVGDTIKDAAAPGAMPRSTAATVPVSASIAFGGEAAAGAHDAAATAGARFRVRRVVGKGGMGVVYAAEQESLGREVALKMIPREMAAEAPAAARDTAEERFATEALVTGRLDHPNIVSIHDLGRDTAGNLFISMKLVRGTSWDRLLHRGPGEEARSATERGEEDDPRGAAMGRNDHLDVLLRVCDAMAFAHSRHIIHRDLKPENIMVGEFGEVLVMDWGLALDVTEEGRRARRELLRGKRPPAAGTPRYMPPELALGESDRMGPATDVYLLGGILYEILTGSPPHQGGSLTEVLTAAAGGRVEPARQRVLRLRSGQAPVPDIPEALEAIAARALAPDPEARWSGAAELAQAVRDYLRHQASLDLTSAAAAEVERQERVIADPGTAPVEVYAALSAATSELDQALKLWSGNQAARNGLVRAHLAYAAAAIERGDLELAESQLARAPGRHPRRAALAAEVAAARAARALEAARRRRVVLGLLLLVAIALAVGLVQWREATRARARADAEHVRAMQSLARLFQQMAEASLSNADARTAEVLFAKALQIEDRRETRESLLVARTSGARLDWTGPAEVRGTAVAFGPDGRVVASASRQGDVLLRDAATGKRLMTLGARGAAPAALAFSPDGRLLAWAAEDGAVRLAEVALSGRPGARREARTLGAHEGRGWAIAFSPDGRRVASGGEDRTVRLFDVESGREVAVARGHEAAVYGVAFRPGPKAELASASWDSAIRIWDAATGAPLREIRQPVGWMFVPAYSPDGKLIACGNDQTTVTINDADTGALVVTLRGHERAVEHVVFSPDGRRLATASSDRTVRLWDLGAAKAVVAMRASEIDNQGIGIAWNPDGRRLALAGFDRRLWVWDLEGSGEVATLRGHDRAAAGVRFSPDGRRVASSAWDRTVRVWDVASRREVLKLATHEDQVEEISWGRSGRLIASGGWDKTVRVFEAATGRELRVFRGHEGWIPAVDLSPDERRVASVSADETVRIWEVETGVEARALRGHAGDVLCVAWAPDGRRVASGGSDRTARVWDAETGEEALRLAGHEDAVEGVAWSPDGARIATGSWDRTVRVWDAATGRELAKLAGHEGWVYGVAFSPEGLRLAAAGEDNTVRIWDLETGGQLLKLVGHRGEVQTVAWSPDGKLLASASYDATVRIWRLEPIARLFAAPPAELAAEAERRTGLEIESLDPLKPPEEAEPAETPSPGR